MNTENAADLRLRDFVTSLVDLVREPLDPEVVSGSMSRLAGAFGAQAAAFFVRSQERLELLSVAGAVDAGGIAFLRSEGEAAAGLAIGRGQAVVCAPMSFSEGSSLLGSPVSFDGRPLAAIVLVRRNNGVGPFSSVDQAILQGFTDVLARSLRRDRLEAQIAEQLQKLERQDFRLFTINHVARVLGSVLEMEDLLRLIPDMVSEVVTSESSVICMLHEEDGLLQTRSAKVLDSRRRVPEFAVPLTDAFHEWVRTFQGRTAPVVAADDPKVVEALPALSQELERHGLILFTPLVYKDRLMGILAVGRKYTGERYGDRDLEFLSTLAPLASNAIANAQLFDLAIHDGTTGLYVSHYFRRRVMEELKRSRRYGFPVSVTMFDLDLFKQVNDTYGHLTGDQVLREFAGILRRCSRRDIDVVARFGGEEFVALLPETPRDGAVVVAERVRRSVQEHAFCGGRIQLTVSGGVASFPEDALSYEELLERADIQLYRAKRGGRNRVFSKDAEFPAR